MKQLIDKIMQHFEDYVEKRRCLAHKDVSTFFLPYLVQRIRDSTMGCSYFSLVYALCGFEIDSRLQELLQGAGDAKPSDFSGISTFLTIYKGGALERKKKYRLRWLYCSRTWCTCR
ncbi:protein DELAY OF GERMINATION 1-like [Olea europaea var. sylvestris]|uniref:Uncharacterized protein n=1 Tax=Olea europaea subsp. europaea TaxID=158383 RepID=A0A8S0UT50_OLEEU|nr:protein DELAY OF GERMINATION 1-like [Olea europaea var. sylvestris]CAA3020450.1 Hypothetical predicted protein [Olea europaea subsp. europaea]